MTSNFANTPPTADTLPRPVAGDGLDSPVDQAAAYVASAEAIEAIEKRILGQIGGGFYAPASFGNGLTTFTGTWIGFYWNYGSLGFLNLSLAVTANWAGSGFIEVALPSGWTANAGVESMLTGYGFAQPASGAHFECTGIVHAGATRVRFIANRPGSVAGSGVTGSPVAVSGPNSQAIDGVNTPFAFTGDATTTNQDRLFVAGWVVLQ